LVVAAGGSVSVPNPIEQPAPPLPQPAVMLAARTMTRQSTRVLSLTSSPFSPRPRRPGAV